MNKVQVQVRGTGEMLKVIRKAARYMTLIVTTHLNPKNSMERTLGRERSLFTAHPLRQVQMSYGTKERKSPRQRFIDDA